MINFGKLLSLSFWLALKPSSMTNETATIILGGFAAFIVVAIVLNFFAKIKRQNPPLRRLLKKISKMFSTMGLIGFVWLFFSYEQIYILGSRFWFLFWIIGLVVWAVFILLYALRKMPQESGEHKKRQRFLKYLPH